MTRSRRPSLLAPLACLAVATGCGSDSDEKAAPTPDAASSGPAKQAAKVDIAKFEFSPKTTRVKAGGTVTWANADKAPHTAKSEPSAPGKFDTDTLAKGKRKQVRLDKPGRYRYFCAFHRFMEGEVEVVR
ncbi:MAG: cupredoxin domain-containing protein [Actinomycetota bacterium]|nr:cupredoxin domain-containing protein [Actinomycetota bacterium]